MEILCRSRVRRVIAGIGFAFALHAVAGGWSAPALAQVGGGGTTTFTSSTSSGTSYESPPACSVIGSSRTETTVTTTTQLGPGCIGIGDRDVPNPAPDCGGAGPAPPPLDPNFGTAFVVAAGTTNINSHTHTETFECVAAVPAVPWPLLMAAGLLLLGLGAWSLRQARSTAGP